MPPTSQIPGSNVTQITTATTTAVKASGGVLQRIVVLAAVAFTITCNETVNGVSTAKFVLPASLAVGTYEFGVYFRGKIEVVTAGASNLLVAYD